MVDEVRALSQEYARDPDGLVFLRLGEALRVRGEVKMATQVAIRGLQRYPELIEARDLYARLLVDSGAMPQARLLWEGILERSPRHLGAHKGLGFIAYAAGEFDLSLDHLETALAVNPRDESVIQGVRVVREAMQKLEGGGAEAPDQIEVNVFAGLEGADQGMLLFDRQGRVLGGGLRSPDGAEVAEDVAAYVAGVTEEAGRTVRLLGMGRWERLVAEAGNANLHLTRPNDKAGLLVLRDRTIPPGRLSYLSSQANEAAREWLEDQAL